MDTDFVAGLRVGRPPIVLRALDPDGTTIGGAVLKEVYSSEEDLHGEPGSRFYFKHFCVEPDYRGRGVGGALIAFAREVAFEVLRAPILWAASGEVGALALYLRSGAMLYGPDVRAWNDRQSPDDNAALLRFLMSAREATAFRLPRDIRFCWALSISARQAVIARGFLRP